MRERKTYLVLVEFLSLQRCLQIRTLVSHDCFIFLYFLYRFKKTAQLNMLGLVPFNLLIAS